MLGKIKNKKEHNQKSNRLWVWDKISLKTSLERNPSNSSYIFLWMWILTNPLSDCIFLQYPPHACEISRRSKIDSYVSNI